MAEDGPKKGWFQRLADGLTRSSRQMTEQVVSVLTKMQLDDEVARYADLLLRGAPGALAVTKTVLREVGSMPVAAELARMSELSAARFASEECRQGMAAFAEKREPSWAAGRAQQGP